MLSSFIHPHVIPNLYDRLQNTKEDISKQKHYFYICSTEEINSCSTRSNDMHK